MIKNRTILSIIAIVSIWLTSASGTAIDRDDAKIHAQKDESVEIRPLISVENTEFRDIVFSTLVFINMAGVGATSIDEEGERNFIFLSAKGAIQNGHVDLARFPFLSSSIESEVAKISSTSDTCAIQPFGRSGGVSSVIAISSYDSEVDDRDIKCFLYSLSFLFGFQNDFSGNENISEMSKMFINR